MISRRLARRLWGDPRDAVGHTLLLSDPPADATEWRVVGVAGDVREQGAVTAALYLPYAHHRGRLPAQEIDVFVRTEVGTAAALAPAVRSAVHAVDPDLAVYGLQPQSEVRTTAQSLERAGAVLATGLIGFGLLLSAMGVFGVMSHISAGGTRGMGVRRALGARREALLARAIAPAGKTALVGIAVGIAAAWALNRMLAARIAGLPPTPVWLYALVAAVLGMVALGAALLPAIKAALVDPARVLHTDALVVLVALAIPGHLRAQAPQGLALQALEDSMFTWIMPGTPGFCVHFPEGSYAAAHQASLMARLEDAEAHGLTLLGGPAFEPTFFVFFLQDRSRMRRLLGMRAAGFAEMRTASVFLVTNPRWRAFERLAGSPGDLVTQSSAAACAPSAGVPNVA